MTEHLRLTIADLQRRREEIDAVLDSLLRVFGGESAPASVPMPPKQERDAAPRPVQAPPTEEELPASEKHLRMQLLAHLRTSAPCRLSELSEVIGMSAYVTQKRLEELETHLLVHRTGEGSARRWRHGPAPAPAKEAL